LARRSSEPPLAGVGDVLRPNGQLIWVARIEEVVVDVVVVTELAGATRISSA